MVLNSQQEEFLKYYLDPNSETFNNGYASAKKVGYSDEYAKNLLSRTEWLSELVKDADMANKAVQNLDEFLRMETVEPVVGAFGIMRDRKTGEVLLRDNVGKMKLKLDTSKFVAERLVRKKFGQEGKKTIVPIQINFTDEKEKYA